MHSTYTVPAALLFGIFIAGYALGWLSALARLRGSVIFRSGADLADPSQMLLDRAKAASATHFYQIKCKCGTTVKFRGAHDTGPSDLLPFPEGDTYTCPNCGTAMDLKPVREILRSKPLSP
jgi:phage terminase large subunit GpA-like protein